jgi:hypothetical protein
MKTLRISSALTVLIFLAVLSSKAQEIQTLFRHSRPSGAYGALSNKFTSINGQYANLAEIYGGWFINKKFMIGVGAAASTNNLQVPIEYSTDPLRNMSWQYGQFGLTTEYVFWSNKVVHVNVGLFSGAGFTVQYERKWDDWDDDSFDSDDVDHDENFFFVMEPGVQVEVNVLRWMRFSPGVSYRRSFGSDGMGLKDSDISDWSYNLTLKFGKF